MTIPQESPKPAGSNSPSIGSAPCTVVVGPDDGYHTIESVVRAAIGTGHADTKVTTFRNGKACSLGTNVRPGDTVTILPRIQGGSRSVLERSFRGISVRITIEYLTKLGGERVGETTVSGDGWTAELSSRTVTIGPSLELTEVTVRLEGNPGELEAVMEQFAKKAMRAGG